MCRALLPSMRAAGAGQVFNVTSQLGRLVIPGVGHYSPTKFALEALSEQLAYETVAQGIEVTIIQPGGYPTKIWEKQLAPTAALKARTPEALLAAYPQMTAQMGVAGGGGGDTDPMDVPRAIADIIAMPAGTRPLRRAVHPVARPQEPINEVSAQQQLAMLGGAADEKTAIGDIVGTAFTEGEIVDAIEKIVNTYLGIRNDGERFIDTYRRVGIDPFKETLYAAH